MPTKQRPTSSAPHPRARGRSRAPRRRRRPLGNLAPLIETPKAHHLSEPINDVEHRRRQVADLCKLLGARFNRASATTTTPATSTPLSPRVRQTLDRMLAGDSEKQIARAMGVSPHTVHVYVKALYRAFDVCSRGELLARFVQR